MDGNLTKPNQGFMVDEATQFCGDFSLTDVCGQVLLCKWSTCCLSTPVVRGHTALKSLQESKLRLGISCCSFIHNFDENRTFHVSEDSWHHSSLLRNLPWIPCMVNLCDSNPRNAPSLLFKVAQSCLIHNHRSWKEFIRICLIFRQQLSSNLCLETSCSNVSRLTSSESCVQVSAIVFLQDLVFRCQLSCLLRILCSSVSCRVSSGSCVQVSGVMLP